MESADASSRAKDSDAEQPIPATWRPMLRRVVQCIAAGDYDSVGAVEGVEPLGTAVADHIRASVADYGATLVELPEDTWRTSAARWMGTHWDVLVDLWTAEEGPSDLVLGCRVAETDTGLRLTIHMVYVP